PRGCSRAAGRRRGWQVASSSLGQVAMTWDSGSRVLPALLGLLTLGAATTAAPPAAWALDSERAYTSASQQISSVSAGLGAIQAAIQKSRGEERTAAQRIADAVLLMGSRDYE